MKHPYEVLKPEYSHLLSVMTVRKECRDLVDHTAVKLLGLRSRYEPVTAANGVPIVLIAPSFEREASSNFKLNPAQGWPLTGISKNIPHNGPFRTWFDAAIAAYHLNGLDRVGAGNWTWELICYYGEAFNGFGPRDYHHMHTSYLWGGTNIQTPGKYVRDGVFDPTVMDEQLGIIPVGRRMVEIEPSLALPFVIAPPIASGISAPETGVDVKWVQTQLNRLGWQPPLLVDGSSGRNTMAAVRHFQQNFGLKDDGGYAGPEVVKALKDAVAAIEADAKVAT